MCSTKCRSSFFFPPSYCEQLQSAFLHHMSTSSFHSEVAQRCADDNSSHEKNMSLQKAN